MPKINRIIFAAIFLASFCSPPFFLDALPIKPEFGPPTPEELAAGKVLAERLRSSVPEENSEIHGKLIIKGEGGLKEIPIVCRVVLGETNWETDYEVGGNGQTNAERLIVIHSTNGPSEYLYARAESPSGELSKPALVPPSEAIIPLAGSDFSLADLGMEFLHWPVQRQMKNEMRLGQPCYVLESRNPEGQGIVRVKSYIDKDSGGPLIVYGYDAKGHLIKEFSLGGSSFTKVHGRWQLEKMDITNKKTGSHTELKFDLDK